MLLLLPLGKLSLSLFALIESYNIRQNAAGGSFELMLRNRSVIDYFFLRLKYSLRPVCQLQVAGGAAAVNPSKALNSQPCYFKFGAVNRSLLYFINRISLVPTFFKSQSALIPLLLLSDRDSLRWIRSRFLAGDETKISGMKPPDIRWQQSGYFKRKA